MTSEYDSHSDDDEEIVVSKRKRNAVLNDESEDEATVDVLNQTNKTNTDDEVVNDDSMKDKPFNDNSIVNSSEIEILSKKKGNESDSDDNSIGNDSVSDTPIGDEIEDSNQSEILPKYDDNEKLLEKKYTFDPSIYDAEESDEENGSKSPQEAMEYEKKYTFDPSIYDAEESDEENGSKSPQEAMEYERPCDEGQNKLAKGKKSIPKVKSPKQQNKGKKQKPNDNMREIRRESQRMVRESQVILPYHIPKQRTLAEFLNRKKSAPSIPIRTTAEQLISLSKQIEQLEKESQEFFKSDSSDNNDDDDDEDYVPESSKMSKSESAQAIDGDDNATNESKVDENLNKDKVTNDVEGFINPGKLNEDESNATNVARMLTDVAERLQNEIGDNSLKDSGNNDENLQLLTIKSTKMSADYNDTDTQLLELSVDKSNEQQNNSKEENILCKENTLTSKNTVNSANKSSLETISSYDNRDKSDCEDFTLDLTMPEDSETVVDHKEKSKEDSLTFDLTMPEDSLTVLEHKEKNSEEFSTLDLTVPEDSETVVEHKEKNNEEFSTLDLTVPEDSETVVEHKEKNSEEFSTLDLTVPEDSETVVEHKEEDKKKSLVKENKISGDCGIYNNVFEAVHQENTDLYSYSKENKSSSKSKKFLSKINVDLTEVPTLSKSFGGEINLDSPPKKTGMIDLRERFFKHYAMDRKKTKSKSPLKVSVVSASVDEKGQVEDISKEVISVSSKPDEQWLEEIKEAEFPGAKHSKLKAFLESKAKEKWKEDYKKRLQEYKLNEEEMEEGDKADYEHEAILDDEDEEADMTNSEEEEDDEEELVENDVELVDKKRKQSNFVEDEADVSEDEVESENGGDGEEVVEENEDDLLGYNESEDEIKDSDSENRDRRKKKTKKRRTESVVDSEDNSENDEESESESPIRKTKLISSDDEETSQSMEDLADICSGKFPTQPVSFSQLEMTDSDNLLKGFADTNSQLVGASQSFDLSMPEQSQSLDTSREESEKEQEEEGSTKRRKTTALDSDDEEEDVDGIVLNRSHKKRAKAVEYSDDEDEKTKPETQNNDDEIGSENSEELVLDEIGNEELELEYDSEENEVVRDPRAFFEKEAELSESEWGSEDEDEKDLDKFEEEAGDQEELDEDEVNRELGKIHMQQMLVDDKRDVRILQELLLEDGELHSDGSGRQRQFRWANADSGFVGGDPNVKDSDDDDSDQGEDEENWRKKRHERELFLNKKNARLKELGIEEEEDEEEEDDGLLGMGRALVKRMQTTSTSKASINVTSRVGAAAVTMNCKFMAKNMRGSFLTSSDQYLSRLAHITTKVGSESSVNGPKNSRNFVFSIVSPKKDEEKEAVAKDTNKIKKRKASDNAANAKKKIHFSDDKGKEKRKSLLEVLG